MKFALIIEAIDKASKPIRAIAKAIAQTEKSAQLAAKASAAQVNPLYRSAAAAKMLAEAEAKAATNAAKLATSAAKAAAVLQRQKLAAENLKKAMAGAAVAAGQMVKLTAKLALQLSAIRAATVLAGFSAGKKQFAAALTYDKQRQKLMAAGVKAAKVDGEIEKVGEWARTAGRPVADMQEAYVNLVKDGLKPTATTMRYLSAQAYLNQTSLVDEGTALTDKYGKTGKAIAQVGRIMAKNKKFQKAEADYSTSMEAGVERIKDTYASFSNKMMKAGMFEFLNGKLGELNSKIDEAFKTGQMDQWAKEFNTFVTQNFDKAIVVATEFGKALQKIGNFLLAVKDAVGGWENAFIGFFIVMNAARIHAIAAAFIALTTALAGATVGLYAMSWPMLAVVAGIALLGVAAIVFKDQFIAVFKAIGDFFAETLAKIEKGLTYLETLFTSIPEKLSALGNSDIFKLDEATRVQIDLEFKTKGDNIASFEKSVEDKLKGVKNWITGSKVPDLEVPITPKVAPATPQVNLRQQGMAVERMEQRLSALQKVFTDVSTAIAAWAPKDDIKRAMDAAEAVIKGLSFHDHGVALMKTLAAGIVAGAHHAVSAVQATVQKMRDLLPHSPAKTGPLSDLDKVRFTQTLAGAIDPSPAVKAVKQVAAMMRAALPTDMATRFSGQNDNAKQAAVGLGQSSRNNGAGGAGTDNQGSRSFTLSPVFNITGGDKAGADDIMEKLREKAWELAEIVNGEGKRRDRLSFG